MTTGLHRRRLLTVLPALALLPLARPARAQIDQSVRTIRIVVPFAAGGVPDVVARVIAEPLSRILEKTVIVENRPGAGGTLGATAVARSPADGSTLFIGTSAFILNKALNPALPYDPVADFTSICEVANSPNVFVVGAKLGISSMAEFISYAKSRTDGVSYASPGIGTTPQLAVELLRVRAGLPLVHVPFNNAPQIIQALDTGVVPFSCAAAPLVQAHVASGALKALAVTSAKRWAGMPNVPTMAEVGFPDFVLDTMIMLAAPAHLDPSVRKQLSDATQAALKQADVRSMLERVGFDVVARSADQLDARIRSEVILWHDIVRDTQAAAKFQPKP